MNTAVTPELLFRLKSTPFEYGRLRCGSRSSKYSQELTPMSQISAHGSTWCSGRLEMDNQYVLRDIQVCSEITDTYRKVKVGHSTSWLSTIRRVYERRHRVHGWTWTRHPIKYTVFSVEETTSLGNSDATNFLQRTEHMHQPSLPRKQWNLLNACYLVTKVLKLGPTLSYANDWA